MPHFNFEYYTVLGLCNNASARDIHERFHYLCRVRHPDKFAALSDDIREAADEDFKRINIAYAILRDPVRRAEYDRARDHEARDGRREPASSTPHPTFSPPSIDFGELRPDERKTLALTLYNRGARASTAQVEFSTDASWFTADVQPTEGPGYCPIAISVTATGPGGRGTLTEWISVTLDGVTARAELRLTAMMAATRPATTSSRQSFSSPPRMEQQCRKPARRAAPILVAAVAALALGVALYVENLDAMLNQQQRNWVERSHPLASPSDSVVLSHPSPQAAVADVERQTLPTYPRNYPGSWPQPFFEEVVNAGAWGTWVDEPHWRRGAGATDPQTGQDFIWYRCVDADGADSSDAWAIECEDSDGSIHGVTPGQNERCEMSRRMRLRNDAQKPARVYYFTKYR